MGKDSGCGTGFRISSSADGEDGIILIVDLKVNSCTREEMVLLTSRRYVWGRPARRSCCIPSSMRFCSRSMSSSKGGCPPYTGHMGLVVVCEQVDMQVILLGARDGRCFLLTRQPQIESTLSEDQHHAALPDRHHIRSPVRVGELPRNLGTI